MGLLTLLRKLKGSSSEARLLVLGLDNAGKTTILKKLSNEDPTSTTPTQGFNVKTLQQDGFKLNIWDIGGQRQIRDFWKNYYKGTDAIVFVVDSTDKKRQLESAQVLHETLLSDKQLGGVPLLVLANKQDVLSAMEPEKVCGAAVHYKWLGAGSHTDVVVVDAWRCRRRRRRRRRRCGHHCRF